MDILFYETEQGDRPVKTFLDSIGNAQRSKAVAYMSILSLTGSALRLPYSRHLAEGIYELRPTAGGIAVRLLYFFDSECIVITNGFLKKSRKTPPRHLNLALQRRSDYLTRKAAH